MNAELACAAARPGSSLLAAVSVAAFGAPAPAQAGGGLSSGATAAQRPLAAAFAARLLQRLQRQLAFASEAAPAGAILQVVLVIDGDERCTAVDAASAETCAEATLRGDGVIARDLRKVRRVWWQELSGEKVVRSEEKW